MPVPKLNIRAVIAFVHDLAAAVAAWWLAYLFRFNFEIPPFYLASLKEILPCTVLIHAAAFLWFGLYRGLWHYASLPDLRRILLRCIGIGSRGAPGVIHVASTQPAYHVPCCCWPLFCFCSSWEAAALPIGYGRNIGFMDERNWKAISSWCLEREMPQSDW